MLFPTLMPKKKKKKFGSLFLFYLFFYTLFRNMFIGTEGGQGVRRSKEKPKDLILTSIIEGIYRFGRWCFNWFVCLSRSPSGIHDKKKTKKIFIKIIKIWAVQEHCSIKVDMLVTVVDEGNLSAWRISVNSFQLPILMHICKHMPQSYCNHKRVGRSSAAHVFH